MDLEWTDGLCADQIDVLDEAAVNGGAVKVGSVARVVDAGGSPEAEGWAGRRVTVREIAAGHKGKGPFRKRLWVALLVADEAGETRRVLARDLEAGGS
jgi:hypothetical protein